MFQPKGVKFDIYDLITKFIPGGATLLVVILVLPETTVSDFSSIGASGALLLAPVAYILGMIAQGRSSEWFSPGRHFQNAMSRTRKSVTVKSADPLEVVGGRHIERNVWVGIYDRFDLPVKFLSEESPNYDERNREDPALYRKVVHPVLLLLSRFTTIKRDDVKHMPPHYTAERLAFRAANTYVETNEIGNLVRFRSLYTLYRSMILVSFLATVLLLVASVGAALETYTPLLSSWKILLLMAIGSFASIPIFFNGMCSYDRIADGHLIDVFFSVVLQEEG